MKLTPLQNDALTELMNIASGRAAASLAVMLNQRVEMHITETYLLDKESVLQFLRQEMGSNGTAIIQGFDNGIRGNASLLFTHEHATRLVRALLKRKRDLENLSLAELSALAEVGNVMLNACLAILGDQISTHVKYQLPRVGINMPGVDLARLVVGSWETGSRCLLFSSHMEVIQIDIKTHIMLVFVLRDASLQRLLESLIGL